MSVFSRECSEVLEERQIGDEYDGMCAFEDVVETFGHLIDFDEVE